MKIRVADPKKAAGMTGGCTLEVEIGWWTYADEADDSAKELGVVFEDNRYAFYLPTLQKNGEPVSEEAINELKAKANELGFNKISSASGMWIFSETGEAQVEFIWIMWTKEITDEVKQQIPDLAQEIKVLTNQDCVAWENAGSLHFTG